MIPLALSAIFFALLTFATQAAKGNVQTVEEQRAPWSARHALIVVALFFAVWLLGLWTGVSM